MVDAMQHKFEDPNKLTPIYALISRIRLGSPTNVVESAERVAKTILIYYLFEAEPYRRGNPVRRQHKGRPSAGIQHHLPARTRIPERQPVAIYFDAASKILLVSGLWALP